MAKAERTDVTHRRWRMVALVVVVALLVTAPVSLVGLAMFAADGAWEFSGGGVRHWLFIKGSTVGRLGVVAASEAPIRYVVRLAEGTDPGETSATYESGAQPADVLAYYSERCRALGLAVKAPSSPSSTPEAVPPEARLVCEANPAADMADDVYLVASRGASDAMTNVRVIAGPGLILTYSF